MHSIIKIFSLILIIFFTSACSIDNIGRFRASNSPSPEIGSNAHLKSMRLR